MRKKIVCFLFSVFLLFQAAFASKSSAIVDLKESDIFDLITHGEWLIDFYAPWCPHCKKLEPILESFANNYAASFRVRVGKVNIAEHKTLMGRFHINGLPTIYHIKDGKYRMYSGERSLEAFRDFIQLKLWTQIDPLPWWKTPSSFLPRFLGYFHTVAYLLQDLFLFIQKTTGFNDSIVAVLFGFSAIAFAVSLGLLFGVLYDFCFMEDDLLDSAISKRKESFLKYQQMMSQEEEEEEIQQQQEKSQREKKKN
eukprot:Sdes_comp20925_c0_seq2m18344